MASLCVVDETAALAAGGASAAAAAAALGGGSPALGAVATGPLASLPRGVRGPVLRGMRAPVLRGMRAGAALLLGKRLGRWETVAGLAAEVAGPHGVSKLESMASRPWGHWDVAAPPPLGTALLAVNWDAGNTARLKVALARRLSAESPRPAGLAGRASFIVPASHLHTAGCLFRLTQGFLKQLSLRRIEHILDAAADAAADGAAADAAADGAETDALDAVEADAQAANGADDRAAEPPTVGHALLLPLTLAERAAAVWIAVQSCGMDPLRTLLLLGRGRSAIDIASVVWALATDEDNDHVCR